MAVKLNFVLMDEVTGRVSQENLDNIRNLIEKISKNFDFIYLVSHNPEIKSWASTNITVEKADNISRIKVENNAVKNV